MSIDISKSIEALDKLRLEIGDLLETYRKNLVDIIESAMTGMRLALMEAENDSDHEVDLAELGMEYAAEREGYEDR